MASARQKVNTGQGRAAYSHNPPTGKKPAVQEMLSAISLKIYELRKYLVLSLLVSTIAIPLSTLFIIQRDRNRNEMYGEAFWIYGFGVYNKTDNDLIRELPDEWDFENATYKLPEYLGNVTYEYPVFGLIFFAIATYLYPGVQGYQGLWLNFILVLVFNLNLVLISILLGNKVKEHMWAKMFFVGYFMYGLFMSAAGGKLEPIADCLLFMALVLRKEGQMGKAMFTLGLSVQTKIYSVVVFPLLFVEAPASAVWFFVSTLLTIVPFAFLGVNFDSLVAHFLNTTSYSSYIVNGLYPGLFLATPVLDTSPTQYYMWPPALIPLIIYASFMLYTIPLYLPDRKTFLAAGWRQRIDLLKPLYIYMTPGVLFVFRWVMPWYLFWLAPLVVLFEDDRQAAGYMKEVTIVGFAYTFGVFCNYPYFISGPLPDFINEFIFGYQTLFALVAILLVTTLGYLIWRWESEKRERRARLIREAEVRGELVI